MMETIWVMEQECCSRCGALLDYFEVDVCTDCLHDIWFDDDEALYAGFDEGDDV